MAQKTFFDRIAPLFDRRWRKSAKLVSAVRKAAELTRDSVVVDVGGGAGVLAEALAPYVRTITVVEPSVEMLDRCRQKHGVSCVAGTAEFLPVADASVDAVLIVDAFHHFAEQNRAVAEALRVLKPGGRAVLHEYDPTRFWAKFAVRLERIFKLKSRFRTPEELLRLWQQEGFSVGAPARFGRGTYLLRCRKPTPEA